MTKTSLIEALGYLDVHVSSVATDEDRELGRVTWHAWVTAPVLEEAKEDAGLAIGDLPSGDDEEPLVTIFVMNGYSFRPKDGIALIDALDASADTAPFMDIATGNTGWIDPQVEHMFGVYGRIVTVDRVSLAKSWRGLGGIGRFLFESVLDVVAADGAMGVVLVPSPFEMAEDDPGRDAAKEALRALWASAGFADMPDSDVMIANTDYFDFGDRASETLKRFLDAAHKVDA